MNEPTVLSPTEVVLALLDGASRLINGDRSQIDRLALLYAEETDVSHPLAPFPLPVLRTRDDLRGHFAESPGATTGLTGFRATDITVHTTTDPEVVITEFRYRDGGIDGATGTMPCIFVVRVRDGEIVESRDYVDHLGMARAGGGLRALAARLAASVGAGEPGPVGG